MREEDEREGGLHQCRRRKREDKREERMRGRRGGGVREE